jgi:hypothetical protein
LVELPWASIRSVETPELAKLRSALRPVKIVADDEPGVLLFFTSRPEALHQVMQSRLEASSSVGTPRI